VFCLTVLESCCPPREGGALFAGMFRSNWLHPNFFFVKLCAFQPASLLLLCRCLLLSFFHSARLLSFFLSNSFIKTGRCWYLSHMYLLPHLLNLLNRELGNHIFLAPNLLIFERYT
jgi:hypothetical protein